MLLTTTPAAGKGRGRPTKRTATNRKADPKAETTPQIGDRIKYDCPYGCGSDANASYTDRYGAAAWLIRCFSDGCEGQHLPSVAEAFGLPRDAEKPDIVAAIRESYGDPRPRRGPNPLPTLAKVDGSHARLLATSGPLSYLTDARGLSLAVIKAARLGWNGKCVEFPMFRDGQIVAIKRRLPHAGAVIRKPQGSTAWDWPLYPEPEPGPWTLLVEGELDALRMRSVGLPATSVTGGVRQWRPEWAAMLSGRRVVVAFDVDFDDVARERAATLRAAGVAARGIDLRRLGLTERNADLTDYLDGGGTPGQIRALARSRRVVRRAAR